MKKDVVINRIADDDPSEPLKGACLRLVEYVYSHDDIAHLTFTRLAKIAGLDDLLLVVQMTQYLTGASVPLLDMKFELIIENEIFDLDPEYLDEAQRTNKLMHPENGVEVPDYENKIYPYFVPSRAVVEGKQE
ncbi:hypothetical protein PSH84_14195 [Pseudomonas beijingensis]|uniref:hypothetical protein n=1 Tax=Pseudomonas beijingensis TaxID=2954101 RepID=UPI002732CE75|nr:hypothetical protein [Pseudomonas sp. FP830]WLI47912.1 hypothetical protein PSH84_14195 [Pseudomonas sp. FP830]